MKTRVLSLAVATAIMGGCVANSLPQWQSASEITVNVNTSGVVYTAAATDADGDAVKFRVAGELPAGWSLDAASGELTAAPRQTTDAPAGTTIELVAYDDFGGSPLSLVVHFEYGAEQTRHVNFPPAGAAINLQANEAAIVLIKNQPGQNGEAMTGVTFVAQDQQTHTFSLRTEDDYWQLPILLSSGDHQFNGWVDFADGSSTPLADYSLSVNQHVLAGDPANGQITGGHQVSEQGDAVYYLRETQLVRQSFLTGEQDVIWTFDHPRANYYFGVQRGEHKITVLEQKLPTFKLSSPGQAYVTTDGSVPGAFTIYELDLASMSLSETGIAHEPLLDFGPYVVDYDAIHHRFLINAFYAGAGGSTTVDETGEVIEETSVELAGNAYFALDPESAEITLISALPSLVGVAPDISTSPSRTSGGGQAEIHSTPAAPEPGGTPIAPILSVDGDKNLMLVHAFDDEMISLARLTDDGMGFFGQFVGVENQHLVMAVDAQSEEKIGAVSTGLAYDISAKQGGFYSTFYLFGNGTAEFKTQCQTYLVEDLNWQSPLVQPYPSGCINGAAYDLSVIAEQDMAVVTSVNALNLPVALEPDDVFGFNIIFTEGQETLPSIMQSVQAVSLISGQVVTLYTGY